MRDDLVKRLRRFDWMSHDGIVWIEDMADEYLLNAYKTCLRFDNPKGDELLAEIKERNLDWRVR